MEPIIHCDRASTRTPKYLEKGIGAMLELFELVIRYLRVSHPFRMLLHVLWLFCILCLLSTTYIVTFHFQPVLELWLKSRSVNAFARELRTSVAADSKINSELNRLLTVTNGNRVYIFRYHNGTPSANNVPFIFHTNTHEVIRPGTNRVIRFGDRLPSSLIHSQNLAYLNRKCVSINNIQKDPNGANYWLFETRNASAITRCPFYSANGDLIGFVGVDFTDAVSDSALKASEEATRQTSIALGSIFDNS